MSCWFTPSSSGEPPTSSVVVVLRVVGQHQRLDLALAQRLHDAVGAGDRQAVRGGGLDLLEDLGALPRLVLGDELRRAPVDRLRSAPAARPPSSMVTTRSDHTSLGAVGEDLPGPDVAGDAARSAATSRRAIEVIWAATPSALCDPLVLGVVLVAVVRPAADLDLLDLEGVALDGLLLRRPAPGAPMKVMSAPTRSVDDDDVRHPAGQLAEHRQQVRLRRPLGDLARRERRPAAASRTHRAVGGDDQRPALQRAGLTALVALEQPAAHGLDDRPPARPARSAARRRARTRRSSSVSAFSVVCVTSAQTVAYGPGWPRTPAPGRTRP